MVWHSFMLKPRNFFADCIRDGYMDVWATGMPWEVINSSVDNETFQYNPTPAAVKEFECKTKRPRNSLDEQPVHRLSCPRCQHEVVLLYTSCDNKACWSNINPGESGSGYADSKFQTHCPNTECLFHIDHQVLRLQKFRKDMQLLMMNDVPMPGTILTVDGMTVTI